MKRLRRQAAYDAGQFKDALNKLQHLRKTDGPAVANAEQVLGAVKADAYLVATILTYNGQEALLEDTIQRFLYNGELTPALSELAQTLEGQMKNAATQESATAETQQDV